MNPTHQANPYVELFRAPPQPQAQYAAAGGNPYNYAPAPPNAQMPSMATPSDLEMMARQGFLRQQQTLAQMGQGQGQGQMGAMPGRSVGPQSGPGQEMPGYMGMTQEMRERHAREMALREAASREKEMRKKNSRSKPTPSQQILARQAASFPQPTSNSTYLKNALAPPSAVGAAVQSAQAEIEPWADPLDEIEPRELAMARFRKRHEVVADIFSPDTLKEIRAAGDFDPWVGFGKESLEEKVEALERETKELEEKMDGELEAFKKKLQSIENGAEV